MRMMSKIGDRIPYETGRRLLCFNCKDQKSGKKVYSEIKFVIKLTHQAAFIPTWHMHCNPYAISSNKNTSHLNATFGHQKEDKRKVKSLCNCPSFQTEQGTGTRFGSQTHNGGGSPR